MCSDGAVDDRPAPREVVCMMTSLVALSFLRNGTGLVLTDEPLIGMR